MKPEYHNLSIASLTPQIPDRTQPLTIFDFGGPDGKMLASLTRIAVRMFDCTITGMEFSYKDQASSMVGSSGNAELSFVIDGPGGERVTNVKIITNDKFKDAVCGLNVCALALLPYDVSMADLESPRYSPVMAATRF